jgi:hypothetical protein
MMKNADTFTAMATIQMHARCTSRGRRVQPKIHRPMNVDSKKNAARPSIASGAPKTSPTNREYSLQFIPNWNSCTMPVATPSAKLIRKSLPKNRVNRYHAAFPVTTQTVCITAINGASPIVNGTKMKCIDGGGPELPPRHIQRVHPTSSVAVPHIWARVCSAAMGGFNSPVAPVGAGRPTYPRKPLSALRLSKAAATRRRTVGGSKAETLQPMRMSFLFTNSSMPNLPSSRPNPDRFTPPNGSSALSAPTKLTKTMPASIRSATREPWSLSVVNT